MGHKFVYHIVNFYLTWRYRWTGDLVFFFSLLLWIFIFYKMPKQSRTSTEMKEKCMNNGRLTEIKSDWWNLCSSNLWNNWTIQFVGGRGAGCCTKGPRFEFRVRHGCQKLSVLHFQKFFSTFHQNMEKTRWKSCLHKMVKHSTIIWY